MRRNKNFVRFVGGYLASFGDRPEFTAVAYAEMVCGWQDLVAEVGLDTALAMFQEWQARIDRSLRVKEPPTKFLCGWTREGLYLGEGS